MSQVIRDEERAKLLKLYHRKNELLRLSEFGSQLNIWGFFEEVFWRDGKPPQEVEQCEEYLSWRDGKPYRDEQVYRYNPLAVELVRKKDGQGLKQGRRWVLFEPVDTDPITEMMSGEFVITSPITYVGRSRSAKNARYAYGYAIDLDGVGESQLNDLLHQMRIGYLPTANIIVNSGTGLHVYYLFKRPIALFHNIAKVLQKQKLSLISAVWNFATSRIEERQRLGIYQGFRVPDTPTKFGRDVKVVAWLNDDQPLWSVGDLNEVLGEYNSNPLEKWEIELAEKAIFNADRLTKKRAKALYPDWYERVVVQGDKSLGRWQSNRALYEWWKRKLWGQDNVTVGHRYLSLVALGMYAKKCGVSIEELRKDAEGYLSYFESLTNDEENHFTKEDLKGAENGYKDEYSHTPIKWIEHITAIRIDKNKRNGQKQKDHLEIARAIRDIKVKQRGRKDWREGNGRPIATPKNSEHCAKVQAWRRANPNNDNKSQCARETGLSRPTIHKWWKL